VRDKFPPASAQGMVAWHAFDVEEALERAGSSAHGLSAAEAARRLASHGPNALPEPSRVSCLAVVLRQFKSPLVYLLLAATVLELAVGGMRDALVILAVVIANAAIGAFHERRAQRSMESLRKLSSVHCQVRRDGVDARIAARELVPGDLLVLAAGDAVAADARMTTCMVLETAEAALTGESLPVAKHAEPLPAVTPLADRRNLVFSGTQVVAGRGTAVVTATGQHTELGRIAGLVETTPDPPTPLETRIAAFGRHMTRAALVLFAAILAFGTLRGLPFHEILMVSVSQMVSLVPEGLPVAMTIALAVGMQRMAARKAVIRRLAVVETLGSVSVICSDKTGTLTRNEMTVTTVWLPDGRLLEAGGAGYNPEGTIRDESGSPPSDDDHALRALATAAVLCNDARLVPPDPEDPRWRPLGDPTEAALLTFALKALVDPDATRSQHPRCAEIPFDPAAGMMATSHTVAHGHETFLKGAPERIMALCGHALVNDEVVAMDEATRAHTRETASTLAQRSLRLLAFARIPGHLLDPTAGFGPLQGKAILLGIAGEMDPPRDEAAGAVRECITAGIRPVMVTGDHKETGLAIARGIGIASPHDRAVDGSELNAMSDAELARSLDDIAVFARVQPDQKLRIVGAFQSQGRIVAMTGDGVNDAPALVKADVGVAMGITGTEVAKNAAGMIVVDDHFATLVKAVEEGRLVFDNLKRVILFLFATSIDEVVVLLVALLAGLPLPLAAVQILWINIVTEGVLTVTLVMEEPDGGEMKRPPVPAGEPLVNRGQLGRMLSMIITTAGITLAYFAWRLNTGTALDQVRTETFTLLAVCQWFNALNCRSSHASALGRPMLRNRWLCAGLLLGVLLQLAVVYTPVMNEVFHTTPISPAALITIIIAASAVLWVEELRKVIARRHTARLAP
jgi:magnesium-transporting ATPase (P-type)